jgi:DNA invertase Pin-like site-specific DNA recombinase
MTELQFLQQYEKIHKNICSVNQLCKELGITKTTYYRYYKEYIEK